MMHFTILAMLSGAVASLQTSTSSPPAATLTSKSNKIIFTGRSLPQFNQDLFLGVKYADQPARFTPAQLKSTYTSNDSNSVYELAGKSAANTIHYNATQYGHDCPAYGSDTTNLVNQGLITLNEDCHNLNIIRPQTDGDELLPVMIWIFGGGWTQGATADPRYVRYCLGMDGLSSVTDTCRYNMSYIVEQSALNGKPVLGVSINYRLSAFGFLDSEEVRVSLIYIYLSIQRAQMEHRLREIPTSLCVINVLPCGG